MPYFVVLNFQIAVRTPVLLDHDAPPLCTALFGWGSEYPVTPSAFFLHTRFINHRLHVLNLLQFYRQ